MLQNVTSMTGPRYVLISAFGFAVMAALVKEAGSLAFLCYKLFLCAR
ncbi:MAG: hypothetical protein CM15mP74_16420 [Halieaceae bacterium]|nr:MAG: hypothetical protein CM15mP74_16420 [Halieaceae bacterium]